ncbi:uncharacterized protein LOC142766899 [Rhipicephalus microplus]|uniref:uncharacterized protein LOC142766899 n=1 Tax=Rhipicephalus microplus TaxID=6941 RepID=UPI003F6B1D92
MTVLRLVPGSPAHRHYFETLYTHYGAGVTDGVTFEDMLGFEAEVLEPLLQMYSVAPRAYVFERSPYDTSGTWERWTTTIARHYDLTGSEERPRETDAEWERRVGLHMASGAAIDVALAVLRTEASFDEQRLPDVPLSGRQLFYVMLCYMQCGAQHGAALCNEPLKHKEDFSDAFACPPRSKMRSRHQCKSFV